MTGEIPKVSVVGSGAWGMNLVRTFYRLGALKSVCDLSDKALLQVQKEYPTVRTTRDLAEVLQDPEVRGVVVATPPVSHQSVGREALLGGKHLFVEKPLALRLEEGEDLLRLAEERKKILMVGHLLLYHPATLKLKEMISHGDLGELYYLYSHRLNLGQIRREENVLWSLAPHDISVMLYLLEGPPLEVSCTGMPYVQEGVHDVAFCILRFARGVLGHIHVSWLDPHKVRKFTVVGSGKMVVFDDMEATDKMKVFDKGVDTTSYTSYGESLALRFGDILIPHLKVEEPLRLECEHFLTCMADGKGPISDGRQGLEVLKILTAADRSMSEDGRWVPLEGRSDEELYPSRSHPR